MKNIIRSKIRSPYFITDIVATFPFELIVYELEGSDKRIVNIFQLNRVLKAYKVILFFRKLENSFQVNIAAMRMFKYLLWLLLGAFWIGSIFYMEACYHHYEGCSHDSWISIPIIEDFLKKWDQEVTRHGYMFLFSVYAAMQVITGAGLGDIVPSNIVEMGGLNIFLLFGNLLFVYLISDYSAMLILHSRTRVAFKEIALIMQKFLVRNNMMISIQKRVYGYLDLQWEYREGFHIMNNKTLYYDAPEELQNAVQSAKRIEDLNRLPLFQDTDPELLKILSVTSESYILPPNEVVAYAGDMCREFYILEEGFCEEISGLTGDVERILGPMSHFCSVEMLFGITVVNTIKTVTHCKLLRIGCRVVNSAISHFPDIQQDLNTTIEDINNTELLSRLPKPQASALTYQEEIIEDSGSWHIYETSHKKRIDHDYIDPFMSLGAFHFLRFLLLSRTVLPYGKFLLCWEASRLVFAFISGMVFPPLTHLKVTMEWLIYVAVFLDLMAVIDIYIRLHIGYYNKKGILVSHPWYTAKNYVTQDFIFDLLGCLPLNYIFFGSFSKASETMEFNWKENIAKYMLCMNRVIQVRRIPTVFLYKESNLLVHTQTITFFKFMPISLVILNALASIIVAVSMSFEIGSDLSTGAGVKLTSWIAAFRDKFPDKRLDDDPLFTQIMTFYWVTECCIAVGFGDITSQDGTEMTLFIVMTVTGYLLYTYIAVKIASSKASLNINLTLYQERMRHLVSFMNSEEDIPKELKEQIIDHFEHLWQRTRGVRASRIIAKMHIALKGDAVLYLYESTFVQTPVFAGLGRNFYRRLGMMVVEHYNIKKACIIRLYDIVDNIFIIHKGEVSVVAPDGTQFCILDRGCMFGNIDNCTASRSSVTINATKHLDLLIIPTVQFYALAQDFPIVCARLEKVCLQNLVYVGGREIKGEFRTMDIPGGLQSASSMTTRGFARGFMALITTEATLNQTAATILMLCSYLSCVFIIYEIAFQDHKVFVLIPIFCLEIIFISQIYLGFELGYLDETGETVTNRGRIRKRYIHEWSGFWLDVLSTLPLEAPALLILKSPEKWVWASYLRCNHLLRIVHISRYYSMKLERLNINMLILKLSSIVIYFTLLGHFSACIWYWIGSHDKTNSSWVFDDKKPATTTENRNCKSHYCCSVYFVSGVLTGAALGDFSPRILSEILFSIFFIIASKFAIAVFIGDMSAMVANYTYTLVNMDYETSILKDYMRDNNVSGPLMKKVLSYVQMLWTKERGTQVPDFLNAAPRYLVEGLKKAAYGKHLYETVIFQDCHEDFLRQLTSFMKRYTLFPGNFITHKGEVNNTMYFIHKGIVEVIQEGSTEYLHDVLHERDIFGITQGLRKGRPHTHTFRAVTVAVILTLTLTDWEHLLSFFPASRIEIYRQLQILKF